MDTREPRLPIIKRRSEHCISRKNIDDPALKVLHRLSHAGYTAYLVGGSVRDLLLGRRPKDYDISTSAHPQQIKQLFRNCFLIGRRFRLAHIRFGDQIIETSTFRREPAPDEVPDADVDIYQHRNNTFGTPEEDAFRRDFTVNGLFYDVRDFSVIDHVGGLEDLDRRLIRSIGNAIIRFREDPVRMLRAARFASRLDFTIEEATYQAILSHHDEIQKSAAPRVYEEINRLFPYGSGEKAFRLLHETGLLGDLFPELAAWLAEAPENAPRMWACLAHLDALGEEVDRGAAFRLAALFYAPFRARVRDLGPDGGRRARFEAAHDLIEPAARRFHMPRRTFRDLMTLFAGQYRIENPSGRFSKSRMVSQPLFAEALELYRMGARIGLADPGQVAFWEDTATSLKARASVNEPAVANQGRDSGRRRRRRPRRRRTPAPTT
jgi:poly(A) polymerase